MSANTEAQGSGRGLEAMKWIIVAVLLIVAIVGNFLYRDIMLAVRALPLLLPVKRVPKSVRSFGRLARKRCILR